MGAAQVVLSSRDCGDTLVTGVCVCVYVCVGGGSSVIGSGGQSRMIMEKSDG